MPVYGANLYTFFFSRCSTKYIFSTLPWSNNASLPSPPRPATQGKAPAHEGSGGGRSGGRPGIPPVVVNLNSSSSELKLLRVLQTLVNLSGKDTGERSSVRLSGDMTHDGHLIGL